MAHGEVDYTDYTLQGSFMAAMIDTERDVESKYEGKYEGTAI